MADQRSAGGVCLRMTKKCLRFLISNIGLTLIIVGYSLLGAFAYRQVEGLDEPLNLTQIRKSYMKSLWMTTQVLNILNESEWKRRMNEELKLFQRQIYEVATFDDQPQWTFAKSLLFSVATVTTIGYGDIYPKTSSGRVFTIVYAMVGIPLMMISVVNTGKLLAGCFRFLYGSAVHMRRYGLKKCSSKECCVCCCRGKRPTKRLNPDDFRSNRNACIHIRSGMIAEAEILETETELLETNVEEPKDLQIVVPGWVCPLIMALYTLMGAILFGSWENWSYFESFYFCFITLSTIGLGDFVPGKSFSSPGSQEKTVFCAFYLLFGLTLLAMCFNLAQDHIRKIFKTIGINVHLISDDNDEQLVRE